MKTVFVFFLFFISNVGFTQTLFWQDTNGPYIGNVIVVASDSGDYILGSDYYNSVFRSSNGGNSWGHVLAPAASSFVISDNLAFASTANSIYRSTDAGFTWTNVYSFRSFDQESYFNSLCITSERYILANIYGGGILLSTDAGDTWSFCKGRPSYSIRVLASDYYNRIYAASGGNIFISTNTGISWAQQNFVPISSSINSLIIDKQGIMFAGSDSGGVYKSIDNGQSWSSINNGLVNTHIRTIHMTHSGHLYAGTYGGGLYRSTDSGMNWIRCSNGISSLNINDVSSDNRGNVFIGSYNGFYRSIDEGSTWGQINSGISNMYTYCIGFDFLQNVYAGTVQGLFKYSYIDKEWTFLTLPSYDVRSLAFTSHGLGFAGTNYGMYCTTDGGNNWFLTQLVQSTHSIVIDTAGFIFAGTDSGLYRSTDSGLSWSQLGQSFITVPITDFAFSNHFIFAGSTNGRVFRSEDCGKTWIQTPRLPLVGDTVYNVNNIVYRIVAHPNGTIFASMGVGGVFRSTNHGDMWTYIGFRNTFATLAINTNGVLFAGNQAGFFRSSDEGITWDSVNSGLTNLSINCAGIDSRGFVFVGTAGGPVFVSTQSTTSVDRNIEPSPLIYRLYQNYPNPFNPSTRIEYELQKKSKVKLIIFDILGRDIITLVDQVQKAGIQRIDFNASTLPSGVYFYKLQVGSSIQTKKMLLIR